MAKENKKSAAQMAAEQQAPKTDKKPVEVIQAGDLMNQLKQNGTSKTNLSPDATVMALNGLKGMVHDNPNAAAYYGMSEDTVKKLNQFTLAGFATVLAIEVESKKSEFAVRMLENQPEAINAISEFTGVRIDVKALPAPKDGKVEVPSTAIEVSEEAKKKIKAEKDIENTNPTTNPAEIENEKQLAASLSNLLTKSSDNIDARIKTVINFYRGYLTIQANKAENKDEELKKVKEMTRSAMLAEIADVVGPCPFALNNHGKLFRNYFVKNGAVSAFCFYRRNAENTTKNPMDDSFVADIVKTLIVWSCNSAIADAKRTIAECDRLIKKNEKIIEENKDKNEVAVAKSAVKTWNDQKNKPNAVIEQMEQTLTDINNVSFDGIDTLIEDYNGTDDTKEEYKRAHLIVDNVAKTYYAGTDLTKIDKNAWLHNIQQRAGIIVNLFRDPLSQSISYAESNIVELKEIETKEETPAEEEGKN